MNVQNCCAYISNLFFRIWCFDINKLISENQIKENRLYSFAKVLRNGHVQHKISVNANWLIILHYMEPAALQSVAHIKDEMCNR